MGSGVKGSLVVLGVIIFCSATGVAQVPDSAPRAQVLLRRDIAAAIPQLQKTISLQLEGASLDEALQTVSHRAELPITYNDAILPRDRKVWLTATEIRTDEALEEILRDSGLQLLPLASGQVVVVRARAQGGTVTGLVTDAKSAKPIPSVSVFLERTRWRATTGDDGRYRLEDVTAGAYTLTARRIGYAKQSQSVSVAAGQEMAVDLVLQAAPTTLDEVVVTVTGEQRRVELGNAIGMISADSLVGTTSVTSVADLINARVPGAQVLLSDGFSGGSPRLRLRGINSFSVSNDPIVIVDGTRVESSASRLGQVGLTPGRLSDLNPDEIESIEVVKGPSAATL